MRPDLEPYSPLHQVDHYSDEERYHLTPFFTNLEKPVYGSLIFSPEVIGALCSRTSRAPGDLRKIFLNEYITPFLHPERNDKDTDSSFAEKQKYGQNLKALIDFLHEHSLQDLFSNPRARSFYVKWLAQYGDDSIAQMAGLHIGFSSISQVAVKHLEDQRIGLAPIEKSTRYVNFGDKINGHYLYYTDPTLESMGLKREYEAAMDKLFETNQRLIPKLAEFLQKKFPEEKPSVVEKKAFDTLRGLLPSSSLTQVAFFGNGQAFEYLITRCGQHSLGELRWIASAVLDEINEVAPSFVRRQLDDAKQEQVTAYQEYSGKRRERMNPYATRHLADLVSSESNPTVKLVEYDPQGEAKVIAGMLYSAPTNHATWEQNLGAVQSMADTEKIAIIEAYLAGRTQRWQKVGRAFENAFVRFEITMNIGAWRDLQRHRMLTQQRQNFSVHHGYDLPEEVVEAGLSDDFSQAIERTEAVYHKIAAKDPELAQYATTLAHRLRFFQFANLRSCFWEMELRTIPEGHPDYRTIEQEKFRQLQAVYPLITQYMHVNMDSYDFARRGQDERIAAKLAALTK